MPSNRSMARSARRRICRVFGVVLCATLLVVGGPGSGRGVSAANRPKTKAAKTAKPVKATKPPAPAVPVTTPVVRKKMVVGTITEPAGLDPAAVAGDLTGVASIIAIYDQLIDTPWGKPPRPGLAESFTESPDRLSWTLRVRSGVKFHDGTDLTADAVKFNLDRHRKSRFTGVAVSVIKSVDVIDPMTVRLSLDKPFGALPNLLGGNIGIMLSPKAIQEKGDVLNRQPTDAGTGPYILKEWLPGDRIVVVRNPDYWGTPKPRLDQITFKIIIDEQSRLAALQAGDVQSIVTLFPDTVRRAVGDGFVAVDPPAAGSLAIFFNNAKPPFDDIRMRRAAALALDTTAIGAALGDERAVKQGFGLWPTDNPWYSPAGEAPTFDRAAARASVNDYIRTSGLDASFTILYVGAGSSTLDYIRLLTKYWGDAGIAVKTSAAADFNQLLLALGTRQFEAVVFGVGLDKDPDTTAYSVLRSTSPANFARYKNVEMDAALDDGRSAADPAARKAAYARVQEIFRRDVPFLVGSSGTAHIVSAKTVCGIEATGGFPAKTAGIGNC